jgi:hypothetical protein
LLFFLRNPNLFGKVQGFHSFFAKLGLIQFFVKFRFALFLQNPVFDLFVKSRFYSLPQKSNINLFFSKIRVFVHFSKPIFSLFFYKNPHSLPTLSKSPSLWKSAFYQFFSKAHLFTPFFTKIRLLCPFFYKINFFKSQFTSLLLVRTFVPFSEFISQLLCKKQSCAIRPDLHPQFVFCARGISLVFKWGEFCGPPCFCLDCLSWFLGQELGSFLIVKIWMC